MSTRSLRACSADVVTEDNGAAMVEFGIVAPLLLMLIVGIYQYGIVLNQYVMLTGSTAAGARLFAVSRSAATPYSSSVSLIKTAAPTLTPASITFAFSVNGVACSSDASCATALAAGVNDGATVGTSYPCSIKIPFFTSPGCTLTAQTTERVE